MRAVREQSLNCRETQEWEEKAEEQSGSLRRAMVTDDVSCSIYHECSVPEDRIFLMNATIEYY